MSRSDVLNTSGTRKNPDDVLLSVVLSSSHCCRRMEELASDKPSFLSVSIINDIRWLYFAGEK